MRAARALLLESCAAELGRYTATHARCRPVFGLTAQHSLCGARTHLSPRRHRGMFSALLRDYTSTGAKDMPIAPGPTAGIRDLTDEVLTRTMAALRAKLSPREISALEKLVADGTFFDTSTLLSAVSNARDDEGT